MNAGRKKAQGISQCIKNFFLPHHTNSGHPHLLRWKIVGSVLVLAIFIELASLFQTVGLLQSMGQLASVLPGVVVALTNDERTSNQLSALTTNSLLTEAAQNAADDMAQKGYFAHVSPDGKLPWYWLTQVGYNYQYAGQNLAVNYNDSSQLLTAWMDSPTHRANILGANFTQIGVGMATGTYEGNEAVFVVQFFASPQQAHVETPAVATVTKPPVRPTPVATASGVVANVEGNSTTSPAVLGATTNVPEHLTFWQTVETSPATYATYALVALALFFVLMLLLNIFPFSKHRLHPRALLNGAILIGVVITIIVLNQKIIFTGVVLPSNNQNASVILATQP